MKVSVDEFMTVFHADRSIADKRHTALPTMGMTRELKVERVLEVEFIERIRFMNKGDDGFVFLMPFPGSGGAWSASPNGVEAIDEDVFSFDV